MAPKKVAAAAARKAAEPTAKALKTAAVAAAKATPASSSSAAPSSAASGGVHMYAIPSCDTIRKARAWLDAKKIPYTFHDYAPRKSASFVSPLSAELLQRWMDELGWDTVLNANSTTFKQMSPASRAKVVGAATAIPLLLEKPSMIKRPVVEWGTVGEGRVTVGFNAEAWAAIAKK